MVNNDVIQPNEMEKSGQRVKILILLLPWITYSIFIRYSIRYNLLSVTDHTLCK